MRGKKRYQETSYKDTATAWVRSNGSPGQDGGSQMERSRRVQEIDIWDRESKDLMIVGV